jgi:hypothetical protein
MSKALDAREIEYAFILKIELVTNKNHSDGFKHDLYITYDLQDSERKSIGLKQKNHTLDSGLLKDDTADIISTVSKSLYGLIRQDKITLSGYDIGDKRGNPV